MQPCALVWRLWAESLSFIRWAAMQQRGPAPPNLPHPTLHPPPAARSSPPSCKHPAAQRSSCAPPVGPLAAGAAQPPRGPEPPRLCWLVWQRAGLAHLLPLLPGLCFTSGHDTQHAAPPPAHPTPPPHTHTPQRLTPTPPFPHSLAPLQTSCWRMCSTTPRSCAPTCCSPGRATSCSAYSYRWARLAPWHRAQSSPWAPACAHACSAADQAGMRLLAVRRQQVLRPGSRRLNPPPPPPPPPPTTTTTTQQCAHAWP